MSGHLPSDARPWRVRRDEALHNDMLRQTIGIVTRRLSAGKQSVFAEYPGAEVTRQAAIRAKRQAVRQLDSLIPLLRQRI